MNKLLVFISLISSLLACKTYNEDDLNQFDKTIRKYIQKKHQSFERSESGLYYRIKDEGEGRAIKPTDEIEFTYTGRLLNGEIFDAEHRVKPLKYEVRKLIMAWQEASQYLKEGGEIELIAPPSLGYGDHELERIPKNSILHFELKILKVR